MNETQIERGRILGIGGIFFKSARRDELRSWYRDKLGIGSSGADGMFYYTPRGASKEQLTVWSIFPADTEYFQPGEAPFMINYIVDDLDALLEKLAAQDVRVDPHREAGEFGRFAWIYDLDGNKVELWQPA